MRADPRARAGSVDRRDLLIGGVCAAGALLGGSGAALWSPRRPPPGGLDALVPTKLGDWRPVPGGEVVVAEGTDRRTPYDDLLTRIYGAEGAAPVTLLIAYDGSQRGDVRIHRPEGCYPAAGFALSDGELVRVPVAGGSAAIPARLVLAESPLRRERVLYWTRIGAAFPTNGGEQRWAVLREHLAGGAPDGVLVRLSTPEADRERAISTFGAFLAALRASLSPAGAKLLFGGAASPGQDAPPPGDRKGAST